MLVLKPTIVVRGHRGKLSVVIVNDTQRGLWDGRTLRGSK